MGGDIGPQPPSFAVPVKKCGSRLMNQLNFCVIKIFYTLCTTDTNVTAVFNYTATDPALKMLRPFLVLVDSSQIKELVIEVLNYELLAFYEANDKILHLTIDSKSL